MSLEHEEETTTNWMKEAQKGYIRVAALMLLNNKPSHGYEIMIEIKKRTKGFYKPTPGGIYPILTNLEKNEYIIGNWHKQNNRRIKTYSITEKGRIILRNTILKQSEIANNINALFQEFARDVLNIESAKTPFPVMPSPFAAFLGEETKKPTNTKELAQQITQLKQHISILQKKLKITEKALEDKIPKK
ncbi:PadR family transcriptional regulator [Candidatus Bathyarchaeota archaeon]|nr:PadR family transcriptional regulator [Candidatus Bathyarchaeota archaeon]